MVVIGKFIFCFQQSAAQAVLKTDGLMIGEHAISVAISNPPERKMQKKDEEFIPSLGGGKKETEMLVFVWDLICIKSWIDGHSLQVKRQGYRNWKTETKFRD